MEKQFTIEDLRNAFIAGVNRANGEHDSWESYNPMTGYQKPNKEKTFDQFLEELQARTGSAQPK